jgi:ABC-type Fe3+ transport system permease subunit/sugar lactone lactonase YvrE
MLRMMWRNESRSRVWLWRLPLWLIVGLCCFVPVAWLLAQLVFEPRVLVEARLDRFRAALLGRTVLFNASAAAMAAVLALPAGIVLGRGRGIRATLLWFILPISVLLPSIVLAYGWSQFVRLLGLPLEPAGAADVVRCVWTLATWLWPIPAVAMGLALRRMETHVQEQAVLDGVLWRVTLRQLLGPAVAGGCIVCIIAMQEFAVYEPTGISVVATEVRMVFETGAFSSPANPITQPMLAGQGSTLPGSSGQSARAAAAAATSLPLLAVTTLLVLAAVLSGRKLVVSERIDAGAWPAILDVRGRTLAAAWGVVFVTSVVPIAAMSLSLQESSGVSTIWREFAPQLSGSIIIASVTGMMAAVVALLASIGRSRATLWIAATSFLIGGHLLAIGLIRTYNRSAPGVVGDLLMMVYNGLPIIVMALLGRFVWIALLAARMTWGRPWQELRELGALDGAGDRRIAVHLIWPLAWPILGAGAVAVMALSLSEVPATVLISPHRPQPLIPMLMTWVHMLRYDSMIEGSLLLCSLVLVLGIVAASLGWVAVRVSAALGRTLSAPTRFHLLLLAALFPLLHTGCSDARSPDDIWLNTGTGPGQVVYPRGISYSSVHDTFFVVDRLARVQQIDRGGKYVNEWEMPIQANGKPVGLSAAPDGLVYVADTHYQRILVYDPRDPRLSLRQWGSLGREPGQFIYPTDVAFDEAGHVYVAEYGDNDRIQVFDRGGNFIRQFGKFGTGEGEFRRPQSLLIDDGHVYVVDSCNHRIVVFRTDGTFVRNIGRVGSELGEFRYPYGIDQDRAGNLVVAEFGNNRLQKLDKGGRGIATWGAAGRAPGQLAYPWAVAVDRRNRVVAVDSGNNRLQVFQF